MAKFVDLMTIGRHSKYSSSPSPLLPHDLNVNDLLLLPQEEEFVLSIVLEPFRFSARLNDMNHDLPRRYTHKKTATHDDDVERDRSVVLELINFRYEHLERPGVLPILAETSKKVAELAFQMANTLPENHELVCGLRDLLRAKDCFVRAVVSVPGIR